MVKRNSKNVKRRKDIPPEALEAFRAALPLRPHREEALGPRPVCAGIGECETCNRYEDLVEIITMSLSLPPWQTHPIDVVDCEPAPWLDVAEAEQWESARGIYRLLCLATNTKCATCTPVTDFTRHHTLVRWTERYARIPEGPDVGKRARLREWQREQYRRVYGDGFGAHGDLIRETLGDRGLGERI
jgi:hypothetical protein